MRSVAKPLEQSDLKAVLEQWRGEEVEVLLEGKSGGYLARFAGKLGTDDDDDTHYGIDVGGPEAWVRVIPETFVAAQLYEGKDVVAIRHADGETVVRLPRSH